MSISRNPLEADCDDKLIRIFCEDNNSIKANKEGKIKHNTGFKFTVSNAGKYIYIYIYIIYVEYKSPFEDCLCPLSKLIGFRETTLKKYIHRVSFWYIMTVFSALSIKPNSKKNTPHLYPQEFEESNTDEGLRKCQSHAALAKMHELQLNLGPSTKSI